MDSYKHRLAPHILAAARAKAIHLGEAMEDLGRLRQEVDRAVTEAKARAPMA